MQNRLMCIGVSDSRTGSQFRTVLTTTLDAGVMNCLGNCEAILSECLGQVLR